MTTTKPKLYIPRPWQLPHMLATPVGGTVLIVERCEVQPWESPHLRECREELKYFPDGTCGWTLDNLRVYGKTPIGHGPIKCEYPVGTVLACKEAIYWNNEHANYYFAADHQGVGNDRHRSLRKRLAEVAKAAKTVDAERLPIEMCRLFLRTTAIDLRRVDTMTAREANLWGVTATLDRDGTDADRLIAVVTEQQAAKGRWLADDPGAKCGDWAWFRTMERIERC